MQGVVQVEPQHTPFLIDDRPQLFIRGTEDPGLLKAVAVRFQVTPEFTKLSDEVNLRYELSIRYSDSTPKLVRAVDRLPRRVDNTSHAHNPRAFSDTGAVQPSPSCVLRIRAQRIGNPRLQVQQTTINEFPVPPPNPGAAVLLWQPENNPKYLSSPLDW